MKKVLGKIAEVCLRAKNKVNSSATLKRCFIAAVCAAVVICSLGIAVLAVSLSIKTSMADEIITLDEATALEDVDLIVVLGAGLRPDGFPSDMLADRLIVSIDLLNAGVCNTLLMSGDNSGESYNEVAAMSRFAEERGVSSEHIITDGKGYSTYESIFRVAKEFGAEKIVIVTQEYHLFRALYIAKTLGVEAYGVSADLDTYRNQIFREVREHIARFKDFLLTINKD